MVQATSSIGLSREEKYGWVEKNGELTIGG